MIDLQRRRALSYQSAEIAGRRVDTAWPARRSVEPETEGWQSCNADRIAIAQNQKA